MNGTQNMIWFQSNTEFFLKITLSLSGLSNSFKEEHSFTLGVDVYADRDNLVLRRTGVTTSLVALSLKNKTKYTNISSKRIFAFATK